MDVVKTIEQMKNGDVIIVKCEDEGLDYLTKTVWFDMTIFIFGGIMHEPTVLGTYFEDKDIIVKDIIKGIEAIIDMNISFEETKGKLEILYKSEDVIKNGKDENFVCKMV